MNHPENATELESSAGSETPSTWTEGEPGETRLRWNELAHPRTATFATREQAQKYKRGLEAMGFKVDIG
jgi:hypothetical protein